MTATQVFPDPFTPAASTPWWRRSQWRVALALVVVAVLVTAIVATQAFGQGDTYRVATVATRNVDALQNGVATIEPVSQATVAFPVSGTVASVPVAVGDTVTAGQTLASLDTQALMQTLHSKQAALAQAQLNLSKALAGETPSSGLGNATLRSFRSTVSTGGIVLTAATTGPSDAELSAAQQAVLDVQHDVDTALTAATNSFNAALTVCAQAGVAPATTSPSDATPTTTTPASTTAPPSDDDLTACQTAVKDVLTAQTAVSTTQTALANASSALDALIDQRLAAVPPATPTTTAPASPSAPSTPDASTGTGSGRTSSSAGTGSVSSSGSGATSGTSRSSGGATSSSPSAADLASYQAAVDAANDAVTVAEQAVAQASIATPIDGTVVAVNLATGDSVTAASSTANVIVQGVGGYEVSTTVSVDDVTHVAVGQRATVVPDGSHKTLDGTVSSISVVPDSSSSSTSYLVVIGLSDPKAALKNGSTGSVSIVTDSARAALAVPTSAITTNGSRHSVNVLDGDWSRRVTVQVGVVGDTWTEIKSGVTKGQQVVLADLEQPLPGSATNTANSSQQTQVTSLPAGFGRLFGGGGGLRGGGTTR